MSDTAAMGIPLGQLCSSVTYQRSRNIRLETNRRKLIVIFSSQIKIGINRGCLLILRETRLRLSISEFPYYSLFLRPLLSSLFGACCALALLLLAVGLHLTFRHQQFIVQSTDTSGNPCVLRFLNSAFWSL